MQLIINCGLKTNTGRELTPHGTLHAFESCQRWDVVGHSFVISDTEPTLVLVVQTVGDPAHARGAIDRLSHELHQDCIACFEPVSGHGELIGPKAAAWGSFNPAYFVLPNGTRLAECFQVQRIAA